MNLPISSNINIVGPGSIGVTLAALLQESVTVSKRCKVIVIGKGSESQPHSEEHTVECEGRKPRRITLPILTRAQIPYDTTDWNVITTKAYSLREVLISAAESSNSLTKTPLKFVVLCNGLGIFEMVRSLFPHAVVLRGLVHFGAKKSAARCISVIGHPRIVLAAGERHRNELDEIASIFTSSGIEVTIEGCVKTAEWKKAIVNTVVNSIATLFSTQNEGVFYPTICTQYTQPIFNEVTSVMIADGVPIGDMTWEHFVVQVSSFGKNINSTLADYRAGRPTELDFFLGEILRRAEKLAIPTPTLCCVFDKLRKMNVRF